MHWMIVKDKEYCHMQISCQTLANEDGHELSREEVVKSFKGQGVELIAYNPSFLHAVYELLVWYKLQNNIL